ncbi:hypothetical protein Sjap_024418 [Stephania japonica]|uniref:Uncharacterized protein n=1 Tax=Stephania japonica TaxID=461633 RepID=A0AAP0EDC6_9MAGN
MIPRSTVEGSPSFMYRETECSVQAKSNSSSSMASTTTTTTTALLHSRFSLITANPSPPRSPLSSHALQCPHRRTPQQEQFLHKRIITRTNFSTQPQFGRRRAPISIVCNAGRKIDEFGEEGGGGLRREALVLWAMEGVYVLWLFILPFAPGDPVWAISSETIKSLVDLSLNFFFILPLLNYADFRSQEGSESESKILAVKYTTTGVVGTNVLEAPVLHPMSEGLFNFVIAWTVLFAPLLFTDCRRNRYKGSLDVLWGLMMFLTNAFLIPYMGIRLNETDSESTPKMKSKLGVVMTNGASTVGLIGGSVCLLSILWAVFGRMDGDFGTAAERWQFLLNYIGSERLAYAFIWDIVLYSVFQPWLIGDNLENVQPSMTGIVSNLRFVPVVGLVAYLYCLTPDQEL